MLLGKLDLNGAEVLKTLKEFDEKFSGLLGKLGKFGSVLTGSFAAFESLNIITESFEQVMELGSHLETLHAATGESIHDLYIFGEALTMTGSSADRTQDFVFKLQNAIAGVNEDSKSTSGALNLLHTSSEKLREMPLLEQVETLQKGLGKITDQAQKAAVLKDLFGARQAASFMPILADPEALEKARKSAEPLAALFEDSASAFDELEVAIHGLKNNSLEFFGGVLKEIAPDARTVAQAFAEIDFVGIGAATGKVLNIFIQLGEVIAPLAGKIDDLSRALEHLSTAEVVGGALGFLAGGQWGAKAGVAVADQLVPKDNGEAIGSLLGGLLGGGAKKLPGLPDAQSSPMSALARIGRDAGAGNADPVLTEARSHTRLLERIAENTSRASSRSEADVPVESTL